MAGNSIDQHRSYLNNWLLPVSSISPINGVNGFRRHPDPAFTDSRGARRPAIGVSRVGNRAGNGIRDPRNGAECRPGENGTGTGEEAGRKRASESGLASGGRGGGGAGGGGGGRPCKRSHPRLRPRRAPRGRTGPCRTAIPAAPEGNPG